jgi:hypothetical protein
MIENPVPLASALHTNRMMLMRHALFVALMLQASMVIGSEAGWVRPGMNTNQPVWGLRGGLQFAVPPGGFRWGGPRGLIRLGYPVLTNGGYDLINFIAVEPAVNGRKGFSELERSRLDGVQGKRIWAEGPVAPGNRTNLVAGMLSTPAPGAEQLMVTLRVEKFDNGAHVRLVVSQRSDAPDEIQLAIHAEPDSAAMDYCILTATMGNMARTRLLWLHDELASSLKLYPDYRDTDFAAPTFYPLPRLHRTATGDVLVAVTTDENNPSATFPFPGTRNWYYGGSKVTQYWKKPRAVVRDDLHAAVNARYTYWQSRQPIPGGIAFENFELREKFHEGQRFIFGITRQTPAQLGIMAK